MKNSMANTLSQHSSLTAAHGRKRVGLLGLLAIFLCGFATSASAGSWTLVNTSPSSAKMAGIRAGTTEMWGRDSAGDTYQYISKTNTLELVTTSPSMSGITVGDGKTLWGLSTAASNNIYEFNFKTKAFDNVSGTLTSIGAGAEGVWGVNSANGHVYAYNTSTKSFEPPPHGEPSELFESIYVGDYGIGPWALDSSDNAWLFNTTTGYFDETNGVVTSIAVGSGEVWGITSADTVWMYDPGTEKWVEPDTSARLVEISLGSDSQIWGVNSSGEVYKFNTNPKILRFQLVSPQPPESIYLVRVSAGGAGIFALAGSGNVYKYK